MERGEQLILSHRIQRSPGMIFYSFHPEFGAKLAQSGVAPLSGFLVIQMHKVSGLLQEKTFFDPADNFRFRCIFISSQLNAGNQPGTMRRKTYRRQCIYPKGSYEIFSLLPDSAKRNHHIAKIRGFRSLPITACSRKERLKLTGKNRQFWGLRNIFGTATV